jgi:predicted outer membrane protein
VILGSALGACANDDDDARDGTGVEARPAPTQRVVALSDAEAVGILDALHAGAAEYSTTARDSVSDPELRRLLAVMRADHRALSEELRAIADSLKVAPAAHPVADRVRVAIQDATAALSGAAGGSTDAAILQREIELQEVLLNVLDSTVVPGTRQPLLAQFVAAGRPTLGAHLQRARQLESGIRERAATAAAGIRPATVPPAARPEETERPSEPAPPPPADETPEPTDTAAPPADPDTTASER